MQEEIQEMADYQHVNPYEMMYRNMNFEINEHITRENAEKIARQLGFMHNAFGVIAKDLIKILSFKFETTPHHPQKPQRTIYRVEPTASKYRQRPPLETIEIEESQVEQRREHGTKKRIVETQENGVEPIAVEEKEAEIGIVQKQDGIQDKAPNLDFLGEFAYQKSGHEQSKNTKDKFADAFKERLSRIVEEVAKKNKKPANISLQQSQNTQKQKSKPKPKESTIKKHKNTSLSSPESQSKQLTHSIEQQSKHTLQRQGQDIHQQVAAEPRAPDIFEEFEYKKEERSKSPIVLAPQVRPQAQEEDQPENNKIWQLLQQNRGSPQVYEISDDE